MKEEARKWDKRKVIIVGEGGMGHHRLGIHRLRGAFHGEDATRRNPFAVLRLGHKRSQTKALKVGTII